MERDRAENLVSFMVYDLQKKLEPIGRLELLKDIHQRAFEYFEGVGETADTRSLDRKTDALINRGVQLFAAGQLPEARQSFEQAVDLSTKLAAENPPKRNGSIIWGPATSRLAMSQLRKVI